MRLSVVNAAAPNSGPQPGPAGTSGSLRHVLGSVTRNCCRCHSAQRARAAVRVSSPLIPAAGVCRGPCVRSTKIDWRSCPCSRCTIPPPSKTAPPHSEMARPAPVAQGLGFGILSYQRRLEMICASDSYSQIKIGITKGRNTSASGGGFF